MKNTLTNELDLVRMISEGDEKAFLEIYSRYFKPIRIFIVRYVQSFQLAEDLTQEVFVKIWEHRKKLVEVKSFKAYLFVLAKNHTLNMLKKAARSEIAMSEIIGSYVSNANPTEDLFIDKEYRKVFDKALAAIPERSRQIFQLCREQKKSYEEVAEIMGISKNAIKNHMVFSMRALRLSVEKELGISLNVLLIILFTY